MGYALPLMMVLVAIPHIKRVKHRSLQGLNCWLSFPVTLFSGGLNSPYATSHAGLLG